MQAAKLMRLQAAGLTGIAPGKGKAGAERFELEALQLGDFVHSELARRHTLTKPRLSAQALRH
jgi:hypothetical protein